MGMTDIEGAALKGRRSGSMLDLSKLPARVPRKVAADLVKQHYFAVSARTLERWPIPWQLVNGKAHCTPSQLFAVAEAKLAEAPVVMGGARATHTA